MTSLSPRTAKISQSDMVIIDTSAWVDFFRRDGDLTTKLAVKGLLDAFEGALCGPVEMEFLGGAGHTLPWNDILIATIAKEKDAAVYAHDKHFPIMADLLQIHLYRPGYNGMFNPDY